MSLIKCISIKEWQKTKEVQKTWKDKVRKGAAKKDVSKAEYEAFEKFYV